MDDALDSVDSPWVARTGVIVGMSSTLLGHGAGHSMSYCSQVEEPIWEICMWN